MAKRLYVTPVRGGIHNPDSGRLLPRAGASVIDSPHWQAAIAAGRVTAKVEVDDTPPPAPPAKPEPTPPAHPVRSSAAVEGPATSSVAPSPRQAPSQQAKGQPNRRK